MLDKYCVVPFLPGGRDMNGYDCWGLFRLVFRELGGPELPMFGEVPAGRSDAEARAVLKAIKSKVWQKVDTPRRGDGVVMKIHRDGFPGRVANHVGIMIDDRRMMHATPDRGVTVVSVSHYSVKPLIVGFYRHKDFPA